MVTLTSSPKIWVFDIDDTLYLERDYVRSGFAAVGDHLYKSRGIKGFSSLSWKLFESGVRLDTFNRALVEMKINPEPQLVKELVKIYRDHEPSISLEPKNYQLLRTLKKVNHIAVLTGGNPTSQGQKVKALKLDSLADSIVYAGKYGLELDKPHPWAWREIENIAQCQGQELVYIADNPTKDFLVPLQLNWRAIRVRLKDSEHFDHVTPAGVTEATSLEGAVALLL